MKKSKYFSSRLLQLILITSLCCTSATTVSADAGPTDTPDGVYTEEQLATHDYTLYYADSGDVTPAEADVGDVIGINQSVTDQVYGLDPITGMFWGYGSDTASNGSTTDKYSSVRYYSGNTHNSDTAVNYSFELPVSDFYYVTIGTTNPWDSRKINIYLEGVNVSGDLNLVKSTLVESTYKVEVTDGQLNVDVKGPSTGPYSNYNDPMVGFIKVQKAIPLSYLESKISDLSIKIARQNDNGNNYYTGVSITEATIAITAAQALVDSIAGGTATINSDDVQFGTGGIRDQLKRIAKASTDLVPNIANTAFTPGQQMRDTDGAIIDAHGAGIMYDEITHKYYWYGEYHVGTWPASGVRSYSSTDLLNWKDEGFPLTMIASMDDFSNDPLISTLYAGRNDKDQIFDDIRVGRIIERPKVIYNETTKKYVMWMHIEGSTNDDGTLNQSYAKAEAGVAVSDSPTGPFVYQAGYRMDQAPPDQKDYHPENKGYARDMNLFKDDDGTAYLIYSSEENLTMYISKLTPDYTDITGWHKDGNVDENGKAIRDTSYKAVYGVDYTRVFPGGQREAPAMFKYDGKYYMLTSGATGWSPNENKYTIADHIMGPWSPLVNPFERTLPTDPDPMKAFNTQTTYVIPVDPANGKFIYVGDMWNGGNFANNGAKYVFLPIEFGQGTDISIKWYDSWTLDLLDAMDKVDIITEFPEAVVLGKLPSLPAVVNVRMKGADVSTPVTWTVNSHTPTAVDFSIPGLVTLQAKLPEFNNKAVNIKMYVIPEKTIFFVNSSGYVTTDYNLLTSYMQNTLINKGVADQAYREEDESPWGYVGTDTLPSGSAGGDIFSTIRYLNGGNSSNSPKGKDLSYKFTLNNGSYDIYLGFNDPWTNTSRKANLLINGAVKGAITFTPSNAQAYAGIEVTNNSLDITVRNTASQDPMISWIMIVDNALTPVDDSSMGLAGTSRSSSTVNLTWHKMIGATGYTLYRSDTVDGTYASIYNGRAGEFTDTGLYPNKTFYYKVSSTNGSGVESDLSDVQSVVTLPATAKEIADGITVIAAPAKDATSLTLPEVPDGFSIAIKTSDNAVIGTDGIITPPSTDTTVSLVLEVTRISDGSKADTISISVVVTKKSAEDQQGSTGGSIGVFIQPNNSPTIEVTNDSVKLIVKAELDSATNVANAVITDADMTQAFTVAPQTDDGKKVVQLEIPKVEGAKAYELQLPAAILSSMDASKVIQMKTALGTITLPANMFSKADLGDANKVSIRIASTDASAIGLDESAISQIGSRPVIEVSMKADNKAIVFNNVDIQVTVAIPYKPTDHEAQDADHLVILYMNDNGLATPVPSGKYDPAKEAMVFTTTHFSRFAVARVYKTFDDIAGVLWANTQIEAMASRGIIKGTSDRTYSPNENITRADFISLLVSTLSLTAQFDSSFADVKSTDYYYNAVGIAQKLGITDGVGNNKFDPRAKISRQDMMTFTARAMLIAKKLKAIDGTASDIGSYKDASKISSYAEDSVATLVKNGIIVGDGRNIAPLANTTRAEVAVMLYKVYKK